MVQAASGPLAGPGTAMSPTVMTAASAPLAGPGQAMSPTVLAAASAPLAGPGPAASQAVLTAPMQADGRRCWAVSQICQEVPSLSSFGAALQVRICAPQHCCSCL